MGEERDEQRLQRIEQFKRKAAPSSAWQYSFRDVILYALSIGCKRTARKFVYEKDPEFATLPTFAVVAVHKAKLDYQQLLPNFDPVSRLLFALLTSHARSLPHQHCLTQRSYRLTVTVSCLPGSICNILLLNCRGSCCTANNLCRSFHLYQQMATSLFSQAWLTSKTRAKQQW